jgi:RND family efflux transporter MFP subunit
MATKTQEMIIQKIYFNEMFGEEQMQKYKYTGQSLMLVLLSVFMFTCGHDEKVDNEIKKVKVKTVRVLTKSIALPIQTSGKLYTSTETKLSFKIPGILDAIFVRKGQHVKKNTRLAVLNLIEMNARVNQAKSAYAKAKRDLARVNRLFSDSVATLEQLQNSRTALDIADSDLEVAQFNLRHSEIFAPEDGKILKRFAEEGELVNSGVPVFLYGADSEGWVIRVGVTDKQVVRLKIGDKANVVFDPYPDEVFSAKITEIEAVANPYTGTFEIELKIQGGKRKLFSGFVGKVELYPESNEVFSIIPIESLVEGSEKEGFVYIPAKKSSGVLKKQIKIAEIVGNQILVSKGLSNIGQVITDGVSYLNEESLIEIVN